jgi:hypothetical protein
MALHTMACQLHPYEVSSACLQHLQVDCHGVSVATAQGLKPRVLQEMLFIADRLGCEEDFVDGLDCSQVFLAISHCTFWVGCTAYRHRKWWFRDAVLH